MCLLKVRWDATEGFELPGAIGAEIHQKRIALEESRQQGQIVRDQTERRGEKHSRE